MNAIDWKALKKRNPDDCERERLAASIIAAIRHETELWPSTSRAELLRTLDSKLPQDLPRDHIERYWDDPGDGRWEPFLEALRAKIELEPELAQKICEALKWPRPFALVFRDELGAIDRRRRARGVPGRRFNKGAGVVEGAFGRRLVGLAFSGGGIRSATFNLGVLQALASSDVLSKVDYLSTVSGGGYIGAWLTSWIYRKGFDDVSRALPPAVERDCAPEAQKPVEFLRRFSNYLTPELGLFSADRWTAAAVYVRNVLLNLVTLVLATAAVLLVPRLVLLAAFGDGPFATLQWIEVGAGLALLAIAVAVVVRGLRRIGVDETTPRRMPPDSVLDQRWAILLFAVAPVAVACYEFTQPLWLIARSAPIHQNSSVLWLASAAAGVIVATGAFFIQAFGGFRRAYRSRSKKEHAWRAWPLLVFFSVVTGAAATGLVRAGLEATRWLIRDDGSVEAVAVHFWVIAPAVLLGVISLSAVVVLGLMGLDFPDAGREWLGRFGGWMGIVAFGWVALFGAAAYGPILAAKVVQLGRAAAATITLGWVLSTAFSIWAARSPSTGPNGARKRSATLEVAAQFGPPVFAIGFVVLVSLAVFALLAYHSPHALTASDYLHTGANHWLLLKETAVWPPDPARFVQAPMSFLLPLLFELTSVVVLLSRRVDVNDFSMHHFYKNRIVRCFLGASHRDRRPNPFTGFDDDDDTPLDELTPGKRPERDGVAHSEPYTGPYPIVNACLNYTTGNQLAWQERKAESFVFTPLYCGFEPSADDDADVAIAHPVRQRLSQFGFRPTKDYAYPTKGIQLGTAVATSGAALSPNQGYHSSPAVAFLMTLFDVRLGWWFGNPRSRDTWQRSSPRFALGYLINELLGVSDDRSRFVNVSDGGHFDNLGIYELVRRRCQVIIACDAEEDHGFAFGGLAGAVRKCRTDFGVEIDIDPTRIRPNPDTNRSQTHCVVGTIRYPEDSHPGLLIYLKASLTGGEPADVLEYARQHDAFPHETTGDQWFGESQFESYRELGLHVAESTFGPAIVLRRHFEEGYSDVFSAVKTVWVPPSGAVDATATKHTRTYCELLDVLRSRAQLAFLDRELFPKGELPTVESTDAGRREAFYFCASLIQLLDDIRTDFKLGDQPESENAHVDGWMAIYAQWIRSSPTLRQTWDGVRGTYSKRFQAFWNGLAKRADDPVMRETDDRAAERLVVLLLGDV